ncbi:MAG: GH3 auxin-responsive promoter family protein [Vicinamibacterales bacterium]|nr:GH3 auxin-responsive promoter family protein [Vicinamibacterales bacterium]
MHGLLLAASMQAYRARYWRPVEKRTSAPDAAQSNVLATLLFGNRDTRFGREHGFHDIDGPKRFRERVPVQDYEQLRPYIDEQRRTGNPSLTKEPPLFYAQTSGSTGLPKYIPITQTMLAFHKQEQALFSYLQYRACPAAFAGKAWGIMGASVEGHLDSGHVVGSVSGHLYRSLPGAIQRRFVVPPEVSSIADYELKYLVILRLALNEPSITYIGSPNPSTFLRLIDILNERRETLLHGLATGTFESLEQLEPRLRQIVETRLQPRPELAARLSSEKLLSFANVWPNIRLLTTWTGGSCGISLGQLRSKLPASAVVMELGYQSTEFRGSVALCAETAGGLPPLTHHFFEFVEQSEWDAGRPTFRLLGELEIARRYYVLVTTASGLYRYFMNDLVEVTDFFNATPLLRFVQKGRGVTSLTGEKLYESQAIEGVCRAAARCGVEPTFFVMVADEIASAYCLFVEPARYPPPDAPLLAADVDRTLGELNLEYHGKRQSGRLKALDVIWLKPGTAEAYKLACVRAGQREGQFKPIVLQYRKDLAFSFHACALA